MAGETSYPSASYAAKKSIQSGGSSSQLGYSSRTPMSSETDEQFVQRVTEEIEAEEIRPRVKSAEAAVEKEKPVFHPYRGEGPEPPQLVYFWKEPTDYEKYPDSPVMRLVTEHYLPMGGRSRNSIAVSPISTGLTNYLNALESAKVKNINKIRQAKYEAETSPEYREAMRQYQIALYAREEEYDAKLQAAAAQKEAAFDQQIAAMNALFSAGITPDEIEAKTGYNTTTGAEAGIFTTMVGNLPNAPDLQKLANPDYVVKSPEPVSVEPKQWEYVDKFAPSAEIKAEAVAVAPFGSVYGGSKESMSYLATSNDPAAAAWRKMQESQPYSGPSQETRIAALTGVAPAGATVLPVPEEEKPAYSESVYQQIIADRPLYGQQFTKEELGTAVKTPTGWDITKAGQMKADRVMAADVAASPYLQTLQKANVALEKRQGAIDVITGEIATLGYSTDASRKKYLETEAEQNYYGGLLGGLPLTHRWYEPTEQAREYGVGRFSPTASVATTKLPTTGRDITKERPLYVQQYTPEQLKTATPTETGWDIREAGRLQAQACLDAAVAANPTLQLRRASTLANIERNLAIGFTTTGERTGGGIIADIEKYGYSTDESRIKYLQAEAKDIYYGGLLGGLPLTNRWYEPTSQAVYYGVGRYVPSASSVLAPLPVDISTPTITPNVVESGKVKIGNETYNVSILPMPEQKRDYTPEALLEGPYITTPKYINLGVGPRTLSPSEQTSETAMGLMKDTSIPYTAPILGYTWGFTNWATSFSDNTVYKAFIGGVTSPIHVLDAIPVAEWYLRTPSYQRDTIVGLAYLYAGQSTYETIKDRPADFLAGLAGAFIGFKGVEIAIENIPYTPSVTGAGRFSFGRSVPVPEEGGGLNVLSDTVLSQTLAESDAVINRAYGPSVWRNPTKIADVGATPVVTETVYRAGGPSFTDLLGNKATVNTVFSDVYAESALPKAYGSTIWREPAKIPDIGGYTEGSIILSEEAAYGAGRTAYPDIWREPSKIGNIGDYTEGSLVLSEEAAYRSGRTAYPQYSEAWREPSKIPDVGGGIEGSPILTEGYAQGLVESAYPQYSKTWIDPSKIGNIGEYAEGAVIHSEDFAYGLGKEAYPQYSKIWRDPTKIADIAAGNIAEWDAMKLVSEYGVGRGKTSPWVVSLGYTRKYGPLEERTSLVSLSHKGLRLGLPEDVATDIFKSTRLEPTGRTSPVTPWDVELAVKSTGPESGKITYGLGVRELTYDAGLNLKYYRPILEKILENQGIPNAKAISYDLMEYFIEEGTEPYGSAIQMGVGEEIKQPGLSRIARDIDARTPNPEVWSEDVVEIINRGAKKKIVEVSDGNVKVIGGDKLTDIHPMEEDIAQMQGSEFGNEPERAIYDIGYGFKSEDWIPTEEGLDVMSVSEQSSRKLTGSMMKITSEPRTVASPSMTLEDIIIGPEKAGRIKDIGDYYFVERMNIYKLGKTPLKTYKAPLARAKLESWLDMWGKENAEAVRTQYNEALLSGELKLSFKEPIKTSGPTRTFISPTTMRNVPTTKYAYDEDTLSQLTGEKSSEYYLPKKYPGVSEYKPPSSYRSSYRSPSPYRSVSSSYISRSISSPSRSSPSVSMYVSPSISPSISPSVYEYKYPSKPVSPSISPSVYKSPPPSLSTYRYKSPSPSVYKSPSPYVYKSPSPSPSVYRSPSPSPYSSPSPYKSPPSKPKIVILPSKDEETKGKRRNLAMTTAIQLVHPIRLPESTVFGIGPSYKTKPKKRKYDVEVRLNNKLFRTTTKRASAIEKKFKKGGFWI